MRMPWEKLGEEGVWEYVNLFLYEMKRLLSCWRITEELIGRSSLQGNMSIKARRSRENKKTQSTENIYNHQQSTHNQASPIIINYQNQSSPNFI